LGICWPLQYIPKVEADQLKNEQNYYVWSVQMQNVFNICSLPSSTATQIEYLATQQNSAQTQHTSDKSADEIH
jgi:hypothetical protein